MVLIQVCQRLYTSVVAFTEYSCLAYNFSRDFISNFQQMLELRLVCSDSNGMNTRVTIWVIAEETVSGMLKKDVGCR
jgi:hypothetical protein